MIGGTSEARGLDRSVLGSHRTQRLVLSGRQGIACAQFCLSLPHFSHIVLITTGRYQSIRIIAHASGCLVGMNDIGVVRRSGRHNQIERHTVVSVGNRLFGSVAIETCHIVAVRSQTSLSPVSAHHPLSFHIVRRLGRRKRLWLQLRRRARVQQSPAARREQGKRRCEREQLCQDTPSQPRTPHFVLMSHSLCPFLNPPQRQKAHPAHRSA